MHADTDPHATAVATRDWLGRRRPRRTELFDAWLSAENDAALALGRWLVATSELKGDAYAVYVAALDREARAAEVLRLAVA